MDNGGTAASLEQLLDAAAQARAASEFGQALKLGNQALEMAGQSGISAALAARAHFEQGLTQQFAGRYQQAEGLYLRAAELYHDAGDSDGGLLSQIRLAQCCAGAGELKRAKFLGKRALKQTRPTTAQRALILATLGEVSLQLSELTKALVYFDLALHIHIELDNEAAAYSARQRLGMVLASSGELGRARELLEQCAVYFEQSGDRSRQSRTLGTLAFVYYEHEQLDDARELLRRALALDISGSDVHLAMAAENCLGVVELRLGEPALARKHLLVAARIAEDVGAPGVQALNYMYQGAALLLERRIEEALEHFRLARRQGRGFSAPELEHVPALEAAAHLLSADAQNAQKSWQAAGASSRSYHLVRQALGLATRECGAEEAALARQWLAEDGGESSGPHA